MNINPNIPEINPKLIKLCGIQKLSISIIAIQIKKDRNNQLQNKFKKQTGVWYKERGRTFDKNNKKGYLLRIQLKET